MNLTSIFEKRWLRLLGVGVFISSIIPLKSLAQQANAQFPNSTSYSRSMLKAAWLDVHHTPVYYEGISVNPEAYYASDDNFSINGLESNGLPLIDIPWQIIDAWYLPDPQHKNSFAYGTLDYLFALNPESKKYPKSQDWVTKNFKNTVFLIQYGISDFDDPNLHNQRCYLDLQKYFSQPRIGNSTIYYKNVALTLCFSVFERSVYKVSSNQINSMVPSDVTISDPVLLNKYFSQFPRLWESQVFTDNNVPLLPSEANK